MNGKANSSKWTNVTKGEVSSRSTANWKGNWSKDDDDVFSTYNLRRRNQSHFLLCTIFTIPLSSYAIWWKCSMLDRTGDSMHVCVCVCMSVNSKQYTDNIAYWVFVFHCRFIHWLMWLQHFSVCVRLHNIHILSIWLLFFPRTLHSRWFGCWAHTQQIISNVVGKNSYLALKQQAERQQKSEENWSTHTYKNGSSRVW